MFPQVPATYWRKLSSSDAYFPLSSNSKEDKQGAQRWWMVTGSIAVGLINILCAPAWLHQQRLRKVFRNEADQLKFDGIYYLSCCPLR
ncbi:hypothetical protein GGR51DRAFT_524565 [Nemania sp. FL0031]|nr:hypothetical protein GGR51DRAFT_524565 [Nemania sp. FL0031]